MSCLGMTSERLIEETFSLINSDGEKKMCKNSGGDEKQVRDTGILKNC